MSKKKAKKAAPKKGVRKVVKKAAARIKSAALAVAAAPSRRTASATIFVYDTPAGTRVRTSPQLLTAGHGWIEWTVVNLSSDVMPDVEITWPDGKSPWGGGAFKVAKGNCRKDLNGATPGRFKYNVTCNGYTEDPEVEWPVN